MKIRLYFDEDAARHSLVRDADLGKQRADKLVKVHQHGGGEQWVLVHVEVQAQPDSDLPLRMYRYHHRISDRYEHRVASLAVLGDVEPAWRPGPYHEELWGCRLQFHYPACKLLDLDAALADGSATDNPAAVVIAAHRATQRTAGDLPQRQRRKWELTRRLYERGYTKQDILDVLEARFGEVPDALREQIQVIVGDAELKQLHRQAVLALSLEAFQNSVSELRAG